MIPPTQLPIRVRKVLGEDGETLATQTVYCPRRVLSVSLEECETCDHCRTVHRTLDGGGAVACDGPWLPSNERPKSSGSVASQTAIHQVMTTAVRCVLEDVEVAEVAQLMLTQGLSGLPVVDAEGQAIGIVSKTDLLRGCAPGVRVADVMTHIAFTLPERAPLTHAAAMMAIEGVHRVPVVSEDGQVVGILSALDITRWLAEQEGLLPRPIKEGKR